MMRTLVFINQNDERAFGRNRNKIRMRHLETFAADHANLLSLKGAARLNSLMDVRTMQFCYNPARPNYQAPYGCPKSVDNLFSNF